VAVDAVAAGAGAAAAVAAIDPSVVGAHLSDALQSPIAMVQSGGSRGGGSGSLGTGGAAGIAVGSVVFVLVVGLGCIYCARVAPPAAQKKDPGVAAPHTAETINGSIYADIEE
jgi:hypothetical protein